MKKNILRLLFLITITSLTTLLYANNSEYNSIKGLVINSENKKPLPFATVVITNSDIATTTNSEGVFMIKFPEKNANENLITSFIGYEKTEVPLSELDKEENIISLTPVSISLSEIPVFPTDVEQLISMILQRRELNYQKDSENYRAFYRESIRKNKKYISLTEAVINVNYPGYNSFRRERVNLVIGRKNTDYGKLDTLAFKLQGGPLSALMLDVMRRPYLIFDESEIKNYKFTIESIDRKDDKLLYLISFTPKSTNSTDLFSGKYYVDMESLSIISADFEMDVSDKNAAAKLFIKKKPLMAKVYPTKAVYKVTYKNIDDVWSLSYVRADVNFKINWRRRLFNSNYFTTIEMVMTDKISNENLNSKTSDRLRMNIIMEEAVEGFLDDDFWGDYNIIEPEQPIENAINRIKKNLSNY